MKILPIASNVIEIEHDGMMISIHCSTDCIYVKSESKIEYPAKYIGTNLADNEVKFYKEKEGEQDVQ